MPNIKPIQTPSRQPQGEAVAVSFTRQTGTKQSLQTVIAERLDQLVGQIQSQPPAERQWSVERFQRELGQLSPEAAGQYHQALLDRIDALEQQGVRSRKAPGDQGERYGALMDLYHASRWVRDAYAVAAPPQGSAQVAVPFEGGKE